MLASSVDWGFRVHLRKLISLKLTLDKMMVSEVEGEGWGPRNVGVPSTVDTIGLRIWPPRSNSCAEILRTGVFAPELVFEFDPPETNTKIIQ